MAKELEWEGQSGFVQAAEAAWESQGVVSGWMKSFGGLSFVVVEGAGHMVRFLLSDRFSLLWGC